MADFDREQAEQELYEKNARRAQHISRFAVEAFSLRDNQ